MNEDTSAVAMDSLSTVLMKMKLRALLNVALDAGGDWAVDFPGVEGLSLNVVQKGECWISFAGPRGPTLTRLRAGDCSLLTTPRPFTLSRDPAPKKRARAEQLFEGARDGVVVCQGGGDFLTVGTVFRFEGHFPQIVFGRLPPLIHIAGDSDAAAVLRWSLDRFTAELGGAAVGRSLMLNHLAPVMLLQTLRIYLSTANNEDNWLGALSDPKLSKVLHAMHSEYHREWSLEELATLAGMSRSGFAMTFKNKVGMAPMEYLTHWRMQVACELLDDGNDALAAIARAVGYASESAFSVAFQKIVQRRPGAYRNERAGSRAGSRLE